MRNPVNKKIKRDLISNKGKYLAIFIMMTLAIAMVGGFLVAQKTVKDTYESNQISCKVEDGQIEFSKRLDKDALKVFKKYGAKYEENFSATYYFGNESDRKMIKAFRNRRSMNLASYYSGRAPRSDDEVAIERLYARSNKLKIGDKIKIYDKKYRITGVMAIPDYSVLLRRKGDMLMDLNNFGIVLMTDNALKKLEDEGAQMNYVYSYRFYNRHLSKSKQMDRLADISREITDKGFIFVDSSIKSTNSRISYVADDMGGDLPMMMSLFVIIMVIMAFVFAVIIKSTIEEEATVIGTLRASGYTRKELVSHYMRLPILVTLVSAVVGNVIAYSWLGNRYLNVYYFSFSLSKPIVTFDYYALLITTVLPFAVMIVINLLAIYSKLRLSPLKFLRRELSRSSNRRAFKLPDISFLSRFRIRVFVRNKGSYLVLFLGLLMGNILVLFTMSFIPMLNSYIESIEKTMPSKYQIVLKGPVKDELADRISEAIVKRDRSIIDNPNKKDQLMWVCEAGDLDRNKSELMTTYGLTSIEPLFKNKFDVTLYGVEENGKFFKEKALDAPEIAKGAKETEKKSSEESSAQKDMNKKLDMLITKETSEDKENDKKKSSEYDEQKYREKLDKYDNNDLIFEGYLTKGMMERLNVKKGDIISLKDDYKNKRIRVKVMGETESYSSSLAILMRREDVNRLIDQKPSFYNSVLSNKKGHFKDKEVASIYGSADMTKVGKQFVAKFASIVPTMMFVSVAVYLVVMYVLTKNIIEKYSESISFLRVFGYKDRDINKIYIRVSTICVFIFLIILIPIQDMAAKEILKLAMLKFNGYMSASIPSYAAPLTFIAGMATYLINRFMLLRRIKRIDMSEALKSRG